VQGRERNRSAPLTGHPACTPAAEPKSC
jgi:hypothetical protein